ncbi:MAG: PSD1 domain-containing protein [Verrucomicrobiales bacterium]|nr:PSD1 domain-containing protein [Verrucomicrobiales bacterium]
MTILSKGLWFECHRSHLWVFLVLASVVAGPQFLPGADSRRPIDFNRDIQPILSDNCFACHGPDKHKRKAGLRLDRQEGATARLESGERAIVPGNVEASVLLKVVVAQDDDERMPPAKTGKRLTSAQVGLLRDWIAAGAPWKEHWAYLPVEKPTLPEVRKMDWVKNDIDRFILARLESEGLAPAGEATRETLIRRATLDITGLPPSIAEVDAFLADASPKAYEKVVDRLLASPAFGERLAQHWLDLARYADSDGYHSDNPRSMWQYRDYVIRSFNANKPWDQFTIEQLAGDQLPNPTLDQRIATGFNRNGMSSTEGGADPDEYMNKYVTDRVNTFGTVYLGSSIACTECHDHKYDRFTQKEYYQLYDFFNRIPERGLDSDPAPPFVKVPTPEQSAKHAQLTNDVARLELATRALQDRVDPDLDGRQSTWIQAHRATVLSDWPVASVLSARSTGGADLQALDDHSWRVSGQSPDQDVYELQLKAGPGQREVSALRLEALTDSVLPGGGPGRGTNGAFLLTGVEVEAESADPAREPSPASGLTWGRWSVLGPFKAASAKEALEKAFVPEGDSDLGKTYDEGKLKWLARASWKERVEIPLWGEGLATYLHQTIRSDVPRYLAFALGSDGGAQVWLNGAKMEGGKTFKGKAGEPDRLVVRLKSGENVLRIKVHHGDGSQGFLFAPEDRAVTSVPVAIGVGLADSAAKDHAIALAFDDKPETGWKPMDAVDGKPVSSQAVLVFKSPVGFAGGTFLKVRLKFQGKAAQQTLGRFRVAMTDRTSGWKEFAALPAPVQAALFGGSAGLSEAGLKQVKEYYRGEFLPELKETLAKLAETKKAERDLYNQIPTTRVMEDMPEPRPTHVRVRGDYRSKGEQVFASTPAILPALPSGGPTNRLALAKWLVDPKHPLMSRVTVNRFWALLFGNGLVKTGNEFGVQGELPSHPELLDWLARDFMDSGWNLKGFFKQCVLSATYRQSSKPTPELLVKDPANRLLARGPRFRLSAEMVRDCALDYAGLLDRKRALGGPSVRPYQPAGLWEEKMFGGNRYEESKGADLYRRSLYTLWKRTVLNPTLMTFDAPDRAICTEQRSMTCTPLQAFVTLNEKGFVEAARVLAARVMQEGGSSVQDRLTFAYRTVLARKPSARESEVLVKVYEDLKESYQHDLKSALELIATGESKKAENVNELELVAWTGVANALLNLDETITKE